MKRIQKIVYVGLILNLLFLNSNTVKAQFFEVSLNQKIVNSVLAIEGEVIESIPFFENGKIYTSNKIKIFNCFPLKNESLNLMENAPCSEIYIITKGGEIEGQSQSWSHALQLYRGNIGFFFLNRTERPSLFFNLPSYEVFSGAQGFIEYQADNNRNFYAEDIFSIYANPEEGLIIPTLEQSGNGYNGEKSFIREQWMLCFKVHNFYIENNDLFFDLSLKSRWSNPFSINQLNIEFKYNSDDFGQFPLTSGKIELEESNTLSTTGNSFTFQESQNDKINIGISNFNPSSLDFVGNNYLTLLTAKIDIEGLNLQELEIPKFLIEEGTFSVYDDAGSVFEVNEKIIDFDLGELPICFLSGGITSVNPDNAGAGILANEAFVNGNIARSGIVTINGCGFDDLDENTFCDNLPGGSNGYRVEFELFGGAWVTPLCTDYIKWDDDEIIVHVPSHGHKVSYFFGVPSIFDPSASFFAATGDVRVRTAGSNPSGSEEVTIDFVHRNGKFDNDDDEPTASRALLKGKDNLQEGYELYFTQAFNDNLGISGQNAFKRALNTWRCETLVNFDIKLFSEITNQDFACAIDYGLVEEGSQGDTEVLAITPSDVTDCNVFQVDNEEVSINSFSITFSNAKDWHTSTADVPSDKIDLETVALHELGHALQLFHVANEGAVMEPIAAIQRRALTQAEINGGIHIVQVSNQDPVCDPPMIPIAPTDCLTNTNSVSKGETYFEVVPNPSSNTVYLLSLPRDAERLYLHSIQGNLLLERNIDVPGEEMELDLSNYPNGVYTVSVVVSTNLFTHKIIKQ